MRFFACIDLHGVMTPARPKCPGPIGPYYVPAHTLSLPPRHSHAIWLPPSWTAGRRYLSAPIRYVLGVAAG